MKQALRAKLGWCLAGMVWAGNALAQTAPAGSGTIYACTDAKGRRITADRPIADCVDRDQRVLGATGVELRRVGPTPTDQERATQEAKNRQQEAEQQRQREERSRERAMLLRYPNQAAHDAARAQAIAQVTSQMELGQQRQAELRERRKKIDTEMEFYQQNPKKAPANLRRQLSENNELQLEQQRFLQQQEQEQQRIHQRFDAELVQLRKLWAAS